MDLSGGRNDRSANWATTTAFNRCFLHNKTLAPTRLSFLAIWKKEIYLQIIVSIV